jgi:hypothetical protein
MSEKFPNHIPVESSESAEANIEVFKVPKLHLHPELGKVALIDSGDVPGVARSEVIVPGTPAQGQSERGVVVLDEYKGGSLDTVPGTDQYAAKQEAIANMARTENALNNSGRIEN